ncbi:hypothetical protein [Nitrospina watsonii]|uniref:hypothetical protein n=1 Tax=Nitrospina watsonii TaxID=1323948 RepID=UPI002490EB65|nr:hypothetical protein [Nitrospina watsonii]
MGRLRGGSGNLYRDLKQVWCQTRGISTIWPDSAGGAETLLKQRDWGRVAGQGTGGAGGNQARFFHPANPAVIFLATGKYSLISYFKVIMANEGFTNYNKVK